MTCWETNSAILGERYPGLLEAILTGGDGIAAEDLTIETAASGAPTLAIRGLHVHSPRDPQREGQRLAESLVAGGENPAAPAVVLGFGLGYAAQSLAELAPQRPIIIVEKNISILRLALEQRDLTSLLSRNYVAFVPGGSGEGIIKVLSFFEKNTDEHSAPLIVRNRALTSIDEQWYDTVENRIRAWAMRDDVNMATLKRFGMRWVRNIWRNMDAIRNLPGISRLTGLASEPNPLPVFLAAAGPSLDCVAPLLPEIHQRCIVVAVDTSLRFMQRSGIHPDFALVVDPQFWNSRHLVRCESPRTRLIIESAVYPPVLQLPCKGMYLCGSLFPLGKFVEERVNPKGALGAGGSVATTAWDFARMLGARQIWIAGLDLSYPGLKTHFRGALFEERALAESKRLNPAETWLYHALRDGIPFTAPSMSGGQVLTDRRLSLYASWFENNFRQNPGIRNYCLGEGGGLAIAGLEPAAVETILALPQRRAEIDHRLEAAFSRIEADFFEPEEQRRRAQRYENAVAALRCGLEQIVAVCKQGEKIAMRGMRTGTKREKVLAELDAINRAIADSEVKEIAGFLLPPDVAEIGGAGGDFQAYLQSSLRLYRSLAEAAGMEARRV